MSAETTNAEQQLLALYDRVADAPDAIPRLRRFVLNLAVRGKLVKQDPSDEPAPALLAQIVAEKARLVEAGEIKRPKSYTNDASDIPFELPPSWTWTVIEDVARVEMGQSPPSQHYNQNKDGIAFFQGKADFGERYPTPRYWCTQPTKLADPGDILLSVRAPVGPTNVARERCCIGRGLAALRPFEGLNREFMLRAINALENDLAERGFGTTFVAINKKQLTSFPFPLPPLAEQHRIVEKVEELMALLDRLEATRTAAEFTRDRLTTASLSRLTSPDSTRETFPIYARFALNSLPALTTRTDQIQSLRQTILDLAVRGELVEQDPTDEPASELLKRVAEETAKVEKSGPRRKSKPLPEFDAADAPFELPDGWAWARFPELGMFGRGKSKHRPRNDPALYNDGTFRMIQTGDVARSGGRITTYTSKYNEIGLAQSMLWPKGTLCITIAANIADSGILDFEACFPDSVVGFVPASVFGNARYFEYFVRTAKANLLQFAPATAQKNINLEILKSVLIPLPPLLEQHRIVVKVDELMALCDRLEAARAMTDTTKQRMLEVLLHRVLEGNAYEREAA